MAKVTSPEIRKNYIVFMAMAVCKAAGVAAVDSDGSSNWMMFADDVTPLVDSLIERNVFQQAEVLEEERSP